MGLSIPRRGKGGAKKKNKVKKTPTNGTPAKPVDLGMRAKSIRPGLMVYCTARVQGGVSYSHEDVTEEMDGVTEVKKMVTIKETTNVLERKAAEKLRTKIRGMVANACWPSMFGLFCPLEDKDGKGPTALRQAVVEAQELVSTFNQETESCRVLLTVIPARVESSDAVAMAGIAAEMKATCEEMKNELSLGRPEAARKLANRMRDLGRMLDSNSADVANEAIKAARRAARAIVKDGANTAAEAADILKDINLGPIDEARVAFLDLESKCVERVADEAPVADLQRVAGIELDPEEGDDPIIAPVFEEQGELELE